ncbi:Ribosomal protein lysine methyltransferase [Microsporum audouinii]
MDYLSLLDTLGHEVEDAEQDAFIQFSDPIPSSDLGFVDCRSNNVELTVNGEEFTIHQSPTILSSTRAGGTTGAVLWQVTPRLAEWLCKKDNPLWKSSILNQDSAVAELGCGISGLLALSLGPKVGNYIATDQEYVRKLFNENIQENTAQGASSGKERGKSGKKTTSLDRRQKHHRDRRDSPVRARGDQKSNVLEKIKFVPLDWELDSPDMLKRSIGAEEGDLGFDIVIACDCIYNDALIEPFVATCADICRLRPALKTDGNNMRPEEELKPTICIVGQQLRSYEVFEDWLRETLEEFRVWRVKDEVAGRTLGSGSGFTVHLLVLREGS